MLTRLLPLAIALLLSNSVAADQPLHSSASQSLRLAVGYFTTHVASFGGYLWTYSEDLSKREGEGAADENTVWVQPPGTPSVGIAFLDAYDATEDEFYLDAAIDVGRCLVDGQLRSGGWDYRIVFDQKQRKRYAYRVDPPRDSARNTTTLDDNTTQAAIRFLMRLDETLGFRNKQIHESAEFALQSLLKAQYPNGAWPQRFDSSPDSTDFPVLKASYPNSWSRSHPKNNYSGYYTFNDNTIADVIDVMFLAERTYDDTRYEEAAARAGEFILSAQMPEPQPAWAQQYDSQMHPAWARHFEPPSITGGESQGILRTLLRLYRDTGDRRYIEPVPRAIEYLRDSRLEDGQLARFYELETNRPLYFTRTYNLTYDDGDLPTHYAFKVASKLDRIQQDYKRLLQLSPDQLGPPKSAKPKLSKSLESQVRKVLAALDHQGRWVEPGSLKRHDDDANITHIIDCHTFIRNAQVLSRYLAACAAN